MLNAREVLIVQMLADGRPRKQIKDELGGICVQHLDRLILVAKQKVGARNAAQLVANALRAGLIR